MRLLTSAQVDVLLNAVGKALNAMPPGSDSRRQLAAQIGPIVQHVQCSGVAPGEIPEDAVFPMGYPEAVIRTAIAQGVPEDPLDAQLMLSEMLASVRSSVIEVPVYPLAVPKACPSCGLGDYLVQDVVVTEASARSIDGVLVVQPTHDEKSILSSRVICAVCGLEAINSGEFKAIEVRIDQ